MSRDTFVTPELVLQVERTRREAAERLRALRQARPKQVRAADNVTIKPKGTSHQRRKTPAEWEASELDCDY